MTTLTRIQPPRTDRRLLGGAFAAGLLAAAGRTGVMAQEATSGTGDATAQIVAAANAFLDTLSETEWEAVLFDWTDTAQRQRWSNLPESLFERDGLMWGNITTEQQEAWLG